MGLETRNMVGKRDHNVPEITTDENRPQRLLLNALCHHLVKFEMADNHLRRFDTSDDFFNPTIFLKIAFSDRGFDRAIILRPEANCPLEKMRS